MVAGASTRAVSTLEALSTVTSSVRWIFSSSFGSSGFWPAGAAGWASSGPAVSTPRPRRARSSRFIVVLLKKVTRYLRLRAGPATSP
jgi:hypothetical protein